VLYLLWPDMSLKYAEDVLLYPSFGYSFPLFKISAILKDPAESEVITYWPAVFSLKPDISEKAENTN
jgi:hypothetical protein